MLAVGKESASASTASSGAAVSIDQGSAPFAAKAECGRSVRAPTHARLTLLNMTPSWGSHMEIRADPNVARALELIRSAWRNNTAHDNLFYHTDGLFHHTDGRSAYGRRSPSSSGAAARTVFDFILSAMSSA